MLRCGLQGHAERHGYVRTNQAEVTLTPGQEQCTATLFPWRSAQQCGIAPVRQSITIIKGYIVSQDHGLTPWSLVVNFVLQIAYWIAQSSSYLLRLQLT